MGQGCQVIHHLRDRRRGPGPPPADRDVQAAQVPARRQHARRVAQNGPVAEKDVQALQVGRCFRRQLAGSAELETVQRRARKPCRLNSSPARACICQRRPAGCGEMLIHPKCVSPHLRMLSGGGCQAAHRRRCASAGAKPPLPRASERASRLGSWASACPSCSGACGFLHPSKPDRSSRLRPVSAPSCAGTTSLYEYSCRRGRELKLPVGGGGRKGGQGRQHSGGRRLAGCPHLNLLQTAGALLQQREALERHGPLQILKRELHAANHQTAQARQGRQRAGLQPGACGWSEAGKRQRKGFDRQERRPASDTDGGRP